MPDKGLLPYRVKSSRLPSGTRRAFLVDEDGIPEPYSTLYVTMHFRNGNRSLATQEAALNSINALFAYARKYSIDLVSRFKRGEYLGRLECEALRRTVQRNFSAQAQEISSVQRGKKGHIYISATVASSTQYSRVTYIGRFLEWLAIDLYLGSETTKLDEIDTMVQRIFSLRTGRAGRSTGAKREFTEADDAFLMQSIEINGPMNPFAKSTQLRNALLICMMRLLGKRRGEVLNIQLRDIRLREQEIDIVRRADTVEDPRRLQPLVKTRQHTIPFGESLSTLISAYLKQRREIPGATKQPYLFVTHKAGPSQGQPMTIDALKGLCCTNRPA